MLDATNEPPQKGRRVGGLEIGFDTIVLQTSLHYDASVAGCVNVKGDDGQDVDLVRLGKSSIDASLLVSSSHHVQRRKRVWLARCAQKRTETCSPLNEYPLAKIPKSRPSSEKSDKYWER